MALTKVSGQMSNATPISVLDFGADNTGASNSATAIQNAFDEIVAKGGGKVIFPKGTYIFEGSVTCSAPVEIDLDQSTVQRTNGIGGFRFTGSRLVIKNGIIDGNNNPVNRAHLVRYENASGTVILDGVTLQNNVAGYPTPTTNQDTDLFYPVKFDELLVNDCSFILASRQGITIADAASRIVITNSYFQQCYLFGIDVEPDSPVAADDMYDFIIIQNNVFKDCGPVSPTNKVWNVGGPFAHFCAFSKIITKHLVIADNVCLNELVTSAQSSPLFAPFVRMDHFRSATVSNNTFTDIERVLINGVPAGSDSGKLVFDGNTVEQRNSSLETTCYILDTEHITISGNHLHRLNPEATQELTITGNTFSRPSLGSYGVQAYASAGKINITGNSFENFTNAIETTNQSTNYLVSGNSQTNCTNFFGPNTPSSSDIGVNEDEQMVVNGNIIATGAIRSGSFLVSVPNTGVATTILDLTDTPRMGLICVRDVSSSVRIGAMGLFANYFDGLNNSSTLSSVQNSPINSSALTLSGQNLQFAHTWPNGTRNVSVYIIDLSFAG